MGRPDGANLVLVIDHDTEVRRTLRRTMLRHGLDVVHAATGLVGLELIQRLPGAFRFVMIDLDLPGLSGSAVVETLIHFRPELPLVCMSAARVINGAGKGSGCLSKPLDEAELETQILDVLAGRGSAWNAAGGVSAEALASARARYETTGDLLEAALELSRGLPSEDI